MATEETSHTSTANESWPALFRAPHPPGNGDLWTQIRQNLELAAKLLPLVWSAFLFVGGLNFLFYYRDIHFMPELDLKASITVLTTSASMGIFLLIILSATLIGPALSWLAVINQKTLKSLWYDDGGKLLQWSAILWFILPLAGFIVANLLMYLGWSWCGMLSIEVGLPVSIILILTITGLYLRKRLRDHLTKEDKRGAYISLLGSTFLSILLFVPLLVVVSGTIRSEPEYNTNQTVWIFIIMSMVLLYNIVIVSAYAHMPILKFFLATVMVLFMFYLFFPFGQFIPKGTMRWFQFGSMEHASLILDESGCNISRSHGLSVEKRVPDSKTCVLPDVTILSRLGTPYYIQMGGASQKRLTIPSQNVLSWSVIESKKTSLAGSPQGP